MSVFSKTIALMNNQGGYLEAWLRYFRLQDLTINVARARGDMDENPEEIDGFVDVDSTGLTDLSEEDIRLLTNHQQDKIVLGDVVLKAQQILATSASAVDCSVRTAVSNAVDRAYTSLTPRVHQLGDDTFSLHENN